MNSQEIALLFATLFCLFFTGASAQSNSQAIPEEFGMWASLKVKKKLSKKWDISAKYAHRRRDNLYQLRSQFVEVKLTRDLPNKWTTSLYVRPIQGPTESRLRFSHAFNKSIKIQKLSIKYRLKHDVEHSFVDEPAEWGVTLRNKIGLQYKLKKMGLKPAVFVEVNNDYEERFYLYDRLRFKGIVEYNVNDKIDLDLGYIIQQQYNKKNVRRDYVISLGLTYEI